MCSQRVIIFFQKCDLRQPQVAQNATCDTSRTMLVASRRYRRLAAAASRKVKKIWKIFEPKNTKKHQKNLDTSTCGCCKSENMKKRKRP